MAKPLHLIEAEKLIGTTEIPGPKSNAEIMKMASDARGWLGAPYTNDDVAWCGLFVAACLARAGHPVPPRVFGPKQNQPFVGLRARAWEEYGANLRPSVICPGAIVTLWRPPKASGFGHVAFYVGEDDTDYYLLGGNQANQVNIRRFPKTRVTAIRWPRGLPVIGGPVRMSPKGIPLTNGNEA